MPFDKYILLLVISLSITHTSLAQNTLPPTGVQSILLDDSDNDYLTKKEFQLYTQNIRKGGRLIAIGSGLVMTSAFLYTFGFTGLGNSHRSMAPVFMVSLATVSAFSGFALITTGGVKIAKNPLLKNRNESAQIHYQMSPIRASIHLRF